MVSRQTNLQSTTKQNINIAPLVILLRCKLVIDHRLQKYDGREKHDSVLPGIFKIRQAIATKIYSNTYVNELNANCSAKEVYQLGFKFMELSECQFEYYRGYRTRSYTNLTSLSAMVIIVQSGPKRGPSFGVTKWNPNCTATAQ